LALGLFKSRKYLEVIREHQLKGVEQDLLFGLVGETFSVTKVSSVVICDGAHLVDMRGV
jgi:hypothetical protein